MRITLMCAVAPRAVEEAVVELPEGATLVQALERAGWLQPKSGSYPVAGSAAGGFGGPMTGAMRSLT